MGKGLPNVVSTHELVSRTYKELLQLNTEKGFFFSKGQKDLNRNFSEKNLNRYFSENI